MSFDSIILGMDKTLLIIILLVLGLLAFLCVFFYLSIVFVKPSHAKIVERFGKYKKVILKNKGFIIPIIDKVVCDLDLGINVFNTEKPLSICINNAIYKITYSFSYFIVDPEKYYKLQNTLGNLEVKISGIISEFYSNKRITSIKELFEFNKDELISFLCANFIEYSIRIDDFVFRTVSKEE